MDEWNIAYKNATLPIVSFPIKLELTWYVLNALVFGCFTFATNQKVCLDETMAVFH